MESRSMFVCLIRATRAGFVEGMLPEEVEAMKAHGVYLDELVKEMRFFLIGPLVEPDRHKAPLIHAAAPCPYISSGPFSPVPFADDVPG